MITLQALPKHAKQKQNIKGSQILPGNSVIESAA